MISALWDNVPLVASFSAIFLAQVLKVPLHYWHRRRFDWTRFAGAGGMPSSHSAGVCALAAATWYREGAGSTMFALTCVLGVIVMYDAMGIRRHAGEQAMAINQLEAAFDKHIETDDPEFSRRHLARQRRHLKELLGHQPVEVLGGAVFGVVVGLVFSLVRS